MDQDRWRSSPALGTSSLGGQKDSTGAPCQQLGEHLILS